MAIAREEAIFINFYLLAARFLLAFNFKLLIALAHFSSPTSFISAPGG
jgi:hypothetical protein